MHRTANPHFLALGLLLLVPVLVLGQTLPPGDTPPPTAIDLVEQAGDHEMHNADYIIVKDEAINRMKDTGVTYVESYVLYKVLTQAGAKQLAVLRWNFDPQSSFVRVEEINVIRDGKKIPVDVSTVHDLPAPQRSIYWSDRIQTIQLPRLHVGDGIEVKVFKKGYTYALLDNSTPSDERYIPPMEGEYFDIVLFEANVPTLSKKYVLTIPRTREETGEDRRLQAQVYNGGILSSVRYTADSTFYAWWDEDIPAATHEPRQPDQSDFAPKVVMSTAESWEAKSRWFFDVNLNQFEPTPAITEKVNEIFDEAGISNGTEEEKAFALVHWVAQNIRYSGQTMGEGEGFTLHTGEMIFWQRHGVCKDIASMLISMMRAAGMDSYAAMTMAGSRIEDLPADQFNHSVCALRKADGSGWEMYDPTWVPYNHNIWSRLETEQNYLIGTPEGEDMDTIAYSPPKESPLHATHTAQILDDGTLEGTFRFEGEGALDSRLHRLVNHKLTTQQDYLGAVLAPISNAVTDVKFKYHALEDFSRGMWVEISYKVPDYALKVGDGFEFKSPLMQVIPNHTYLFRAAETTWDEERKTDVFLYYTQWVDAEENIELPRGYEVVDTPMIEEVDETYASMKGWSETSRKKGLTVHMQAKVKRRQIPPDDYKGFYRAMTAVGDWADQVYRIEKGGAK